MRRVLLQSAIQNPKSRIQNHVSALRRSELGHGHGQAIAARMHGSAPWKTEETIVGLPRLLVLSAFSRFGGCHLSAPPFPFFEQLCKTEDKSPKSLSHKGVELRRMMYANPILPQRSHRRPVVLDRTTLARLSGRTASQDRSARRRRCHLLHPPGRLPVALPPQGFPPKSTVWKYFDQWRHNGTLETIHDLLRRKVRAEQKPYSPRTSASVDSQSVDTTSGGEQRGRDNAKDVDGRKRHIVVDSMG